MNYKVTTEEKEFLERKGIEDCLLFMFNNMKRRSVRKCFPAPKLQKPNDTLEFDLNKHPKLKLLAKLHDCKNNYFPDSSIYSVIRFSAYFNAQFPG